MIVRKIAVCAAVVPAVLAAARFDGIEHDILDLGGGSVETAEISQKEWNGLQTVVSNGSLVVSKKYWTHGGPTSLGPGASFRVGPGAVLTTGAGDARIRRFTLSPSSELRFEVDRWDMDHTAVAVPRGAKWHADVSKLVLAGSTKDNLWDIAGEAVLLRGIDVAEDNWGCRLKVVLRDGGKLMLGGPVAFNGKKGGLEVVLEGGDVTLFWDGAFAPGIARVAPGARVAVKLAPGVEFDKSALDVPEDAELSVVRMKAPPGGLPARWTFKVQSDAMNRCYYISADHIKDKVKALAFRYPNPDAESGSKTLLAKSKDTLFRRRFPAGDGPWTVQAALRDVYGDTYRTNITIRKTATPKTPPAANDCILVGQCGYGEAADIAEDILKDDLCNLFCGWHSAGKTLGGQLPEEMRGEWEKMVRERPLWSMSIYSGDGADLQKKLAALYSNRYLGNNIGEYASYLYQGDDCRPKSIPNDRNLLESRDHLVNRFVHEVPAGWMGRFPYSFSTCGAALSCYELAGGVDFICNEQWAIGAQNLAHTSAEARGAARKWKPEYWCAWNAHEWQTCSIPYETGQKFDSCYAGFLQEYVFGTSIIVLESGAQSTQAWKYTPARPGQPKEERANEGYDGKTPRRYRETVKKFYEYVKAHPRDKGTPETKIAMALGNLDAYLGLNGGFTVWAQHANAATNKLWKYGAPESTQAALEDLFFPRSQKALEPYANSWLAGTPFGQVDVMSVDDDSSLADLSRYDLLVFGGWNTMTPHVKDVLERYVERGGTLVMSRPELTTRVDRDYENYTDSDLSPLFGFLPPEGRGFVEKKAGKGRYFLFAGRKFPAADAGERKAYLDLVSRLARATAQTVSIDGDAETLKCITYAVYPRKIYFLNVDTRHERTFSWTMGGRSRETTLAPCEIKEVAR